MVKRILPHIFLISFFLHGTAQPVTFRPAAEPGKSSDSILVSLDLKNTGRWKYATSPGRQYGLFPEGASPETYASRVNNAKLCWYNIDPLFYDLCPACPPAILLDSNERSGFFVCPVWETDIFPDRIRDTCCPVNMAVLNLAFYPDQRGPFNFDCSPGLYSAGIDSTGRLNDPASRWGGITREVEGFDLETAADSAAVYGKVLKSLDFWLMDPFVYDPGSSGGTLYFDLGRISEDIFPNGLLDQETSDLGYDNAGDASERQMFRGYLDSVSYRFGYASSAYTSAYADPSGDDFHHFRGYDYDQQNLGIPNRYKKYNGTQGNSTRAPDEPYPTIATLIPDTEDLNRNGRLDSTEAYYQFTLPLSTATLGAGRNHIIGSRQAIRTFPNGVTDTVNWYHFSIPLGASDTTIGDFTLPGHLQSMRIFLKGFEKETHLRFATLELQYMTERPLRGAITVYPNPTSGPLTVDFDSRTPLAIETYDLQGRRLMRQDLPSGTGRTVSFDLSDLSDGIYLLKIISEEETVIRKIVVEK